MVMIRIILLTEKRIFIGGIILFLILTVLPFGVSAAEGECHLKHCLVPAPTTFTPAENEVTSARPAITGLTWKTTVVKVFLDGVELTGVKQVKHEDYYGSFYVKPSFNLAPGRHYVYTIAYSEKPGWYDQSKESEYIYFNVPEPKPITKEPADPASDELDQDKPIDIIEPKVEQEVDIIEPDQELHQVEVEAGRIEGGVSIETETTITKADLMKEEELGESNNTLQEAATFSELGNALEGEFKEKKLQEKMKRNRVIGISLLALLMVIVFVWLAVSRGNIKKDFKREGEGGLPPPPVPPSTKPPESPPTWINEVPKKTSNEEIKIEPIKPEEDDSAIDSLVQEEMDYWASPPPSAYTPYPTEKDDQEKLDN